MAQLRTLVGRFCGVVEAMNDADSGEALQKLERTLAANSGNKVVLNQLATSYFRSGRLEFASRCLDQLIEIDPSDPNPWNNRGICLQAIGRSDQAVESFQTAVQLDPNNFAFLLNYGRSLIAQRRWVDVVEIFSRARAMQPASLECIEGL